MTICWILSIDWSMFVRINTFVIFAVLVFSIASSAKKKSSGETADPVGEAIVQDACKAEASSPIQDLSAKREELSEADRAKLDEGIEQLLKDL